MSIVTLASGGVDSTLMAILTHEEGVEQKMLFIDYGQRASEREWSACERVARRYKLPAPVKMNLRGFGQQVPSGLTSSSSDLYADAFLPGRNMLFLLAGAAFASRHGASSVAIGLLSDDFAIFPDQTRAFLAKAQSLLRTVTMMPRLRIVAPLMHLTKPEVLALAGTKKIHGTYSCHAGTARPCGRCISCLEAKPVSQQRKK